MLSCRRAFPTEKAFLITRALALRSLPERRIALYGRQIADGMLFLTRVGFDVSGCHAGNVMLHQQDWCVLTEFENDPLGLRPLGEPLLAHYLQQPPVLTVRAQAPTPTLRRRTRGSRWSRLA